MSKLSQEPETYKTSYKDRDITLFDMLNNIKNKKSKEDRGGILVEHLYYWAFRLKSKVWR